MLSSFTKVPLILLTFTIVDCMGYFLPDTDYQEKQLLLLSHLLEEAGPTILEKNPEEYSVYDEPVDVLEVKPTDEEIVEALLKQLDNPAQSEALYEELVTSKVRPSPSEESLETSLENIISKRDSESLRHQLDNLSTSRLADPEISFRKTPYSSRRKRSIPPYVSDERGRGYQRQNRRM